MRGIDRINFSNKQQSLSQDSVNVHLFPPTKTLAFLYIMLLAFLIMLLEIAIVGDNSNNSSLTDSMAIVVMISFFGWVIFGMRSILRKREPLDPQSEYLRKITIYNLSKVSTTLVGFGLMFSIFGGIAMQIYFENEKNIAARIFTALAGLLLLLLPFMIGYTLISRYRLHKIKSQQQPLSYYQSGHVDTNTQTQLNQSIDLSTINDTKEKPVYCSNCGSKATNNFCSICGYKLLEEN